MSTSKIRVEPVALQPEQGEYQYTGYNALGCLIAYAKVHNDGALNDAFDFGQITPTVPDAVPDMLREISDKPGVILLSCYVWNHAINMAFAKEVKRRRPGALVVVGGPHVPRMPTPCREFFDKHPYVDVAARNEGELTFAELLWAVEKSGIGAADLSQVDLSDVNGLTFRRKGDLIRTPDRLRNKDLTTFPSPFTTGEFDHWFADKGMMPIETNRGCPYGCTFCDWGAATLAKVHRISMERVKAEIDFAAKQRIADILICDANFGILPRDVDIARYVIEARDRHGFPKRLAYATAKTVTPRVREIIKNVYDAGLTDIAPISVQTTDHQVLENVERSNIKLEEYRKLIDFLHKEGIPTNSDMMLGLPGQTVETCKKDLQFFFDHNVLAVHHRTSVMPNAPMADEDYRRRYKITVSDDGMVDTTYSFTREEHNKMLELCLAYKFFVKIRVLKYFLYFVQLEHGVKAMDFVLNWIEKSAELPDLYPISHRIRNNLLGFDQSIIGGNDWLMIRWADEQAEFLFDDLEAFHNEVIKFLDREHGVRLEGSAVKAVLTANREVMPKKCREYPMTVPLAHDVTGYFAGLGEAPSLDRLPDGYMPLGQRGPGVLELPSQLQCSTYDFFDGRPGASNWELTTNLNL